MAIRVLSQTLRRHSAVAPCALTSPNLRHKSSRSGKLIEIDIQSLPSTSPSSDSEVEAIKIRKFEEAIHAFFVQKSTPDWLPFIPGSSFWVPPRKRPEDVVALVGKLWKPSREEETLNFASGRGWPMLEFFSAKDVAPETMVDFKVEVEVNKDDVEVKVLNGTDNNSESEDGE